MMMILLHTSRLNVFSFCLDRMSRQEYLILHEAYLSPFNRARHPTLLYIVSTFVLLLPGF